MKVQTDKCVIAFHRKDTVKASASRENIFYSFLKLQLCLHAILVVSKALSCNGNMLVFLSALYLRTQMQSKLKYYEAGLEVSEFVFKQT